jgi:hypothetical protein
LPNHSEVAAPLGEFNKKPAPTKGRRIGKRSDPEYVPTTFFVRRETKRKAAQLLLEDANADKDLSDLVEHLLARWVTEHSRV